MTDELINKYRPKTFDEVVGQDKVCKSIQSALAKKRGRAFLLSGPSGVGKTTIGRIIAKEVGCRSYDLFEVDGASTTGIDAMRELLSHLQYASERVRVIIIDEVHAVSSQAVKSLLKSLEEPAPNVYWVLCTTEPGKVPKEIQTRCLHYKLSAVREDDILVLITKVAKTEKLPVRRNPDAMDAIAELAEGSPRKALSILAQCGELKDEDEVRELADANIEASKEAIDLCRLLVKGASWKEVCKCIDSINTPPESVRIVVLRYMAAVAVKGGQAQKMLAIIEEFSQPFLDREGKAPLLLACGRLVF